MRKKEYNINDDVEWRLEEWGRWARGGNNPNIGYSPLSNIGKIMESGGLRIEIIGKKPLPDNYIAEEIERHLNELSRYSKHEAEAIRVYYSSYLCKSAIAQKLRISLRTLNARLQAAKHWLAGRLSADYA